ncbi:hypothetical protein M2650_05660 [Luteimonas sp. SX5]|uniref:Uncharacterized protein n=1 Tax=Luteimonas galliterrae TaxID=2940486 RepID=A0ABT0MHH1_9GAMM|nr:hypothetical protein [Luteimonas galliterrae]MCL1634118.1 hypothetical protein [Luteimonas galliterrae]
MDSRIRHFVSISTAAFALVALVQLVRALTGFAVQLGPYPVPVAASWLIFIAAGALAFWGARMLRRG